MRIIVHDFSGHPFQAQLSRAIASRGHEVAHVHCGSYATGKGELANLPSSATLRMHDIRMASAFARYEPVRRFVQEVTYGVRFCRYAAAFHPDIVLSCNDPLFAKAVFGIWARARRANWIFWLQDFYSIAMANLAAGRAGLIGRAFGWAFQWLERSLLRRATGVIAITADFLPTLHAWGVDAETCTVIENWAPLEELPVRPRLNAWRMEQGLDDSVVFLYSGTLGLKHDPDVLYELAAELPAVHVVVVSEGRGADRLADLQGRRRLANLRLLPYQPYDRLPDVLGAADVLILLLEASAGVYSVPSKALTYLCAGRAILAAVPRENLAARTIEAAGAGLVVSPKDRSSLTAAAARLAGDEALRESLGAQGRTYAEAHFDLDNITERFLSVIGSAARGSNGNRERSNAGSHLGYGQRG